VDSIQFNSINNEGFSRIASYNDTIFKTPNIFDNQDHHSLLDYIRQCPPLTGNKVIDIGCATGDLSIYLANCGYNITGIDLSDNMLLVARNKLLLLKKNIENRNEIIKNPGFIKDYDANILLSAVEPKIKFIKDDIFNLNLIKDKFNIALLSNFISYIHPEDLASMLEKTANLIYSGGFVVISFKTLNYYANKENDKYEDANFNCDFTNSYDRDSQMFGTRCTFNKSAAVSEEYSINFIEYIHSIKTINKLLSDNNLNIIKIFPDTQIYSSSESDINTICEAIESSYSMLNGVKKIVIIAQKNQVQGDVLDVKKTA
jgi:SAM-dependent methyltransferase